jgi:hypothetical protein
MSELCTATWRKLRPLLSTWKRETFDFKRHIL